MKKILLSILMSIGMLNVAHASQNHSSLSTESSLTKADVCKYTLTDALSATKNFVQIAFVPREKSKDGNKQMGFALFHDPNNSDPESLDAMVMIMVDKNTPDKQLVFMVIYTEQKQNIVFKREIKDGGKALGPCFERSIDKNPQK